LEGGSYGVAGSTPPICLTLSVHLGHWSQKPTPPQAERLGTEEKAAIVLAAECAEAGYVRLDVKGPPYRQLPGWAILTEAGRQMLKTPAGRRPSKPRQGNRRPGPAR
jgi:hypothetical protein